MECYRLGAHYSTSTSYMKRIDSSETNQINFFKNDFYRDKYQSNLIYIYKQMVLVENVAVDQHQLIALNHLERLSQDIQKSPFYASNMNQSIGDDEGEDDVPTYFSSMSYFTSLSSFFRTGGNVLQAAQIKHIPPKGVYIHGGVGCGKTFCMNIFYNHLPTQNKQKVHFHKFMLNVHQRMHHAKKSGLKGDEVMNNVIQKIIEDGIIICFDEFQVTDVADALILRRLFTGLLSRGVVIVATSNRSPGDLYLNGLQRDLFLPFIDLLQNKCDVVSMWDSEVDYRLVSGESKALGVYFIGKSGKRDFDEAFLALTKGGRVEPSTLITQGRVVKIPEASLEYRVARFSFDDLCRNAKGAADYLLIGENFHTVFVENIPAMTMNDINIVRRFIVFVDSMYECHVKLILHSETLPDGIFQVDLDNQFCDEAFAFDRTRSRLEEMGSEEYLRSRWAGSVSESVKSLDEGNHIQSSLRNVVLDDRDIHIKEK